jgi:hypothetical protein
MILDEKFSEKYPCPAVPRRGPEAGDTLNYNEFPGKRFGRQTAIWIRYWFGLLLGSS